MSVVVRFTPTSLTAEQYEEASRRVGEALRERLMGVLDEAGIEFSGEPEVFEVHNLERR
jgi:hypothetical protein